MTVLWQERKRLLFFGLPWTFTKYMFTEEKFTVDSGLFTSMQDEIRLYRIVDISLSRTLMQKIFGLGTITCNTSDKTSPILEIKNVKNSQAVKELLSEAVEKERMNKRVSSREYMNLNDIDEDIDEI